MRKQHPNSKRSLQSTYNVMVEGLLTQDRQSNSDGSKDGDCNYRGLNGAKCAAGFLMSDEDFENGVKMRKDFNVCGMEYIEVQEVLGIRRGTRKFKLVSEAQYIHDNHSVEMWPQSFIYLAEQFYLKPSRLAVAKYESQRLKAEMLSQY